jgi:hypothetical protein
MDYSKLVGCLRWNINYYINGDKMTKTKTIFEIVGDKPVKKPLLIFQCDTCAEIFQSESEDPEHECKESKVQV